MLDDINQLIHQAIQLEKQGKIVAAFNNISQLNGLAISSLEQLIQCARIAEKAEKHIEASVWYKQALQLQASNALRGSYLINLMKTGKLDEAEQETRLALKKSAKNVDFLNLLGVILKRKNQLLQAIIAFKQATTLNPRLVSPWINLGNSYLALYEFTKAADAFVKALKIQPNNIETLRLLARAYTESAQYQKAFNALNTAFKIAPNDTSLKAELMSIYFNSGQLELALQLNSELIALEPNNTQHLRHRGIILRNSGNIEQAIAIYQQLLAKNPNDLETILAFGKILRFDTNDRQAANALYEYACQLFPNNIELLGAYCNSLTNSRYGDESEHFAKAYEIALKLLNNDSALLLSVADDLQSVLLRTVDYESLKKLGDSDTLLKYWLNTMKVSALHNQLGRVENLQERLELVNLHKQWGDKIEESINKQSIIRKTRLLKPQKIRIGLMSSDLRYHPVTYFVQPLLEHYDKRQFELYAYSFYPQAPDPIQQRIPTLIDKFSIYPKQNNQQIAQAIADDQLDILFELGGTTFLNKVQVCAYRPAPIQVSWLGYPHSVGMPSIDYILVDPYTKPSIPELILEKPFELAQSWVSLGSLGFNDTPIETSIPQKRQGYLTFGTANNPYKYTPASFEAWALIMQQVDNSRFLFLRPEAGIQAFRDNVCGHFAKYGISKDRILFIPIRGSHLQYYNLIDIALDPFPHVGGTTTCESLWMGVPVITLIGAGIYERLSYSNLVNAGLAELCASRVEDYIKIAVDLAHDNAKREYLRFNLRTQIRNHPLGQTEQFVRNFEAAVIKTLNEYGAN